MTCSRCSGFMLEEMFLDIKGGFGEMWARSARCVNCGHIHDSVIERNRLAQKQSVTFASSAPDYQEEDVHLGVESYVESYYERVA